MKRSKKIISILLAVLLSGIISVGSALADNLIYFDGDRVVSSGNFNFGEIEVDSDYYEDVLLRIQRQGGNNRDIFKDGEDVTISVLSVSSDLINVNIDPKNNTIRLASNWKASGSLSSSIIATIKLSPTSPVVTGQRSANVVFNATGLNQNGENLTVPLTMTFSWREKAPASDPTPSTYDLSFNATGLPEGITSNVSYSYPLSDAPDVTGTVQIGSSISVPAGAEVTYSYPSVISGGDNVQYVVEGTPSPTSPITVNEATVVSASYKTQYYLTVESDYAETSGQGWYDAGADAYAVIEEIEVAGTTGTRYLFDGWEGNAAGNGSCSEAILMDGPKTAVATWQTQYYLSVESNYADVDGEGWYDEGETANATVSSTTVYGTTGTRYVFDRWTDDADGSEARSEGILMDGPKTAAARWQTQYYLSVESDYAEVDGEGWYDEGETVNATVSSTTVYGTPGTRYVFTGWSEDATGSDAESEGIIMNGPKTAMATWKTQYLLTVNSELGYVTGEGWYDAGSSATVRVTQERVDGLAGTSHVFTGWSGDSTATKAYASIKMDAPKTVTANWGFRYGVSNVRLPASAVGKVVKNGSTIPVRWQFNDASGNVVDSGNVSINIRVVRVGSTNSNGEITLTADMAAGNSGLRYDEDTQTWMYNWQTRGIQNGIYKLLISDSNGISSEDIVIEIGK